MSPKYFCRIFRTVIHRTPIDYLNYYRIEKACYLLETEDLSITEVAYHCGFNDSSYFIRCFKKYKQITPTKYLKNNKKIVLYQYNYELYGRPRILIRYIKAALCIQ